jgi:hypothetical protein
MDANRFMTLCNLFEGIWLQRQDPDYYDVDLDNLPALTSPQARRLATFVEGLFDKPQSFRTPAPPTDALSPPLSDYHLGTAMECKAIELGSRDPICALIGQYVDAGQSYTAIPFERRAEFLDKLNALES